MLPLRHGQRKGRHKTAGLQIVVDVRSDAHCDADAIGRRLQSLSVVVEHRPVRCQAAHASRIEPKAPILVSVRHAEQRCFCKVTRLPEPIRQARRADRRQVGREQVLGNQTRPVTVAELDAARPIFPKRCRDSTRREPNFDLGRERLELR